MFIGDIFQWFVRWLAVNAAFLFDAIKSLSSGLISAFEEVLLSVPAYLLIPILTVVAWRVSNRKAAAVTAFSLALCYILGLWTRTMQTIALMVTAIIAALIVAIPLGVFSGLNNRLWAVMRPIMDFMQTVPSWTYMIPAVMFFGIGRTPAIVATIIFAFPQPLRLACLGIRQVPKELVELGESFGATTTQTLLKIRIPSALPSIMTGITQCIMWALAMAVLAGWIGAGGLGYIEWNSLFRLAIGKAFEASLILVLLAMMFDRIFEGLVEKLQKRGY